MDPIPPEHRITDVATLYEGWSDLLKLTIRTAAGGRAFQGVGAEIALVAARTHQLFFERLEQGGVHVPPVDDHRSAVHHRL